MVGASAGGIAALEAMLRGLPADLSATVLVVVHAPRPVGTLRTLLARGCALPVVEARDLAALEHGQVCVGPPDRHLMVADGRIALGRGPRENGHRPAVDALFRTAARDGGARVAGVVLSGAGDDGTAGLRAIVAHGGAALVQDPSEALFPDMPASARAFVAGAETLPAAEIGGRLAELARDPATNGRGRTIERDEMDEPRARRDDVFSCPECGGPVTAREEGGMLRFRCRVGHAWSEMSFLADQSAEVEQALWAALRALEERGIVAERLAGRARDRGNRASADRFRERAEESAERARVVRELIESLSPAPVLAEDAET